MRGMRLMAQGVQKKNIQAAQASHRLGGDFTEVSKISGRTETKAMNFSVAMENLYRFKAGAEQFQRTVNVVDLDAGNSAVFVVGIKNVFENLLQGDCGLRKRVERNLLRAAEAQRPYVVQPENMIRVRMGVNDCIQAADPLADSLLAEIRRGIDEHATLRILQHDRRPGTIVARIC